MSFDWLTEREDEHEKERTGLGLDGMSEIFSSSPVAPISSILSLFSLLPLLVLFSRRKKEGLESSVDGGSSRHAFALIRVWKRGSELSIVPLRPVKLESVRPLLALSFLDFLPDDA